MFSVGKSLERSARVNLLLALCSYSARIPIPSRYALAFECRDFDEVVTAREDFAISVSPHATLIPILLETWVDKVYPF